jgi:hypothetical protein
MAKLVQECSQFRRSQLTKRELTDRWQIFPAGWFNWAAHQASSCFIVLKPHT